MSWYNQGFKGVENEERRIAASATPNRLWIPAGTGRDIVLIDDEPFEIYEHNARINNSWRNHHTCMKGMEDTCISCTTLGAQSRYYVAYLSGVDLTATTDKKGNKYQYEQKLIGAKLGLAKKWRRKKEDRGSLLFTRWKVHREDAKKPATGDEWEYVETLTEEKLEKLFELANYRGKKLTEHWEKAEQDAGYLQALQRQFLLPEMDNGRLPRTLVPFNYFELLKPMGNDAAKSFIAGAAKDDDEAPAAPEGADEDDVPF